jgi:hypothetical protein
MSMVDKKSARERLVHQLGAETLEAEQALCHSQAHHLDNFLQRWLRRYSPAFSIDGDLEPEYRAGAGRVFRVPTLLREATEVEKQAATPGLSASRLAPAREDLDGKTYVRFFFHPVDFPRLEKAGFREDPRIWFGTPSSSHRSLFIAGEGKAPAFVAKVSLTRKMMGFSREIYAHHVARAPITSAFVAEAWRATAGKLPSGIAWDFFPEDFAALPPKNRAAGYVLRSLPATFDPERHFILPYYALLSARTGGNWFEKMFRAAPDTGSRGEFLWQRIVHPMLELYQVLAFEHGLSAELHKQNIGLLVDKRTHAIEGLILRDMDGVAVDLEYRRYLGLSSPAETPAWASEERDVLRAEAAQLCQPFNYFFLGTMNVDQLAKGILPRREAFRLIHRLDRAHLAALNERFGTRLRRISQISRFWESFHARISKPEIFARVPAKKRRYARWSGRFRSWETTLGRVLSTFR